MIAIRVLALLDFLIVLVLCKNSTDVQTTTTSWPNRQILSGKNRDVADKNISYQQIFIS